MRTGMKTLLIFAILATGYTSPGYADSSVKTVIIQNSGNIKWKPLGNGRKLSLMEGSRDSAEMVSFRISFPPNSRLGFHSHRHIERGLVIKGGFRIVYMEGGKEKENRLEEGSFFAIPSGTIHRAYFDKSRNTVLQIITNGPIRNDPAPAH